MSKESSRNSSHGPQNSRTGCSSSRGCKNTTFKLFGVQIDVPKEDESDEPRIRKSKSMGNLEACNVENTGEPSGYVSDGFVHQSSKAHERKRGKTWTEEEHRSFLIGLEKLGKGDWKGIAKNYVPSRSSIQVASHAQKYFLRRAAQEKKRRRTSVFDIPISEATQGSQTTGSSSNKAGESSQQERDASLKKTSELEVQEIMPAPVVNLDRPPLSPMRGRGIPDFLNVAYMPRISSYPRGFPTQAVMPTTFSLFPVMNFPNQSNIFLPQIRGQLTNPANFVPRPPANTTLQHQINQESSQAETPASNNDELDLNIKKLTL